MSAMSDLPISNVGVLNVNGTDLTGTATSQKRAALEHYQNKLQRARKYIEILRDPRLEEMSAQWIANAHGVKVWMVIEIRRKAGIKGHQKRPNERRPDSTRQLERWQR